MAVGKPDGNIPPGPYNFGDRVRNKDLGPTSYATIIDPRIPGNEPRHSTIASGRVWTDEEAKLEPVVRYDDGQTASCYIGYYEIVEKARPEWSAQVDDNGWRA